MKKKLWRKVVLSAAVISLLSAGTAAYAAESYTVERGDYLKKIAEKMYQDASKWELIYETNKDLIKDPNLIYAGQVFVIPDLQTEETAPAADAGEADIPAPALAEAASETEPQPEVPVGDYASLEDYLNDPAVRAEIDDTIESSSNDNFSVRVSAKGNELMMEFKLLVDIGIDASDIEEIYAGHEEYFETAAAEFDEMIGQSGACTLVLHFLNPDDTLIIEKRYKAQ